MQGALDWIVGIEKALPVNLSGGKCREHGMGLAAQKYYLWMGAYQACCAPDLGSREVPRMERPHEIISDWKKSANSRC